MDVFGTNLVVAPPLPDDAVLVVTEEPAVFSLRAWVRDSIGLLASMVAHLAMLLLLALWGISVYRPQSSVLVLNAASDDANLLADEANALLLDSLVADEPQKATESPRDAMDVDLANFSLDRASADLAEVDHDLLAMDSPAAARSEMTSVTDLDSSLGIKAAGAKSVIAVDRPPLRQAATPEEAVSGLGGEIVRQLEAGDVRVVWMFDASLSMKNDRKHAAGQMAKVFDELQKRLEGSAYRHSQALMYFGHNSVQLVAPTDQWSKVTRAALKIPDDVSGIENVLTGLQRAIPEHRKDWSGPLHYIIWTDESGNDAADVEATIEVCRRHQVTVSCVGPTAVLGRFQGTQFYRQDKKYSWWLDVDKGPDALPLQIVQLPHWFQTRVAHSMPSGFGPHALVRLSQQTGGSFTTYDRPTERSGYRPEVLQPYQPDYGDADSVESELRRDPFRRAILDAVVISASAGVPRPPNFQTHFRLWFPAEEYQRRFAAIVTEDLAIAHGVAPRIEEALALLSDPAREAELEYDPSPRWRANYELARGRLAALSVRYREYDLLATAILRGGVLTATTTDAGFEISTKLRSGDWGVKRRDEARKWLTRCANEHAQTPWGDLARMELQTPLGLEIKQRVTYPVEIAAPGGGGGGGSPAPPRL